MALLVVAWSARADNETTTDSIIVNQAITNPSCYSSTDGSIDLTISGGVSPYQIVWSTGATSEDISSLAAGSYSVTITDSGSPNFVLNPAFNWSFTNTGNNHTILMPANCISIDGAPAPSGYVGVFYNTSNGLACGGYEPWTGAINAMAAWGSQAGQNDGFANNEVFKWKFWRASDGSVIDLSATYQSAFMNDSTYVTNGLSGLVSLTGTSTTPIGSLSTVLDFVLQAPVQLSITEIISDYNGFNTSSYGASDGSIDISVSGGVPPYTYLWSTSSTDAQLSNLSAGNYYLSVSDANNCSISMAYSLTEPSQVIQSLNVSSSIIDATCFNSCNGSIELTVSGGYSPYSYAWSNGENSNEIENLCQGNYSVTIYDNGGGLAITPFNWTYTNTGQNHVILIPQGTVSINGNPLIPGDYIGVFYQIGNTLHCGGYHIYEGATTAVTAWGAQSGQTDGFAIGEAFQWKAWLANDQVEVDLTPVYNPGFYNAGNYVNNGMSGISALTGSYSTSTSYDSLVQSFTINAPAALALNAQLSNAETQNNFLGSIDLSVSGGISPYTFNWSNGESTEDLTALQAGSYALTLSDAAACSLDTVFDILQILPINIVASLSDYNGYNVSTNGGSDGWIDLSVTGGSGSYSYLWSTGSIQASIDSLPAGTYTVSVSDNNNQVTASYTLSEPAPALPLSAIENITNPICAGDCNGSIDLSVMGGISPYQFIWSNGMSNEDITSLCAGTYSVTITDSGNGSLSAVPFNWSYANTGANHSILIPDSVPQINGQPLALGDIIGVFFENNGTLTCAGYQTWNGTTTAITAWGAQSGKSDGFAVNEEFKWKVWRAADSVEVSMQASYDNSFNNLGTYINNGLSGLASLTGNYSSNINGQSLILSIDLVDPDPITISAMVDNVDCAGNADGSIDVSVSNGCYPLTYEWSNGLFSEDLNAVPAGQYSVSVECSNGCSASESFVVSEALPLQISETLSDYNGYNISVYNAADGSISLSVNGGTSPYTYLWSNNETTTQISNLTAGSYTVSVTDANNCLMSAEFTLTQPAPVLDPISVSSLTNNPSCNGLCDGSIQLSISGGTSPYQVLWANGHSDSTLDSLCAGDYELTVYDSSPVQKSLNGFDWTYTNTGTNHSILIPAGSITVDGVQADSGDVVGVFFTGLYGLQCGGYKVLPGSTTAVSAWGSQPGQYDGFAIGEEFTWKLWRAADSTEIDLTPVYSTNFPNSNTYITNGMSGISTLTGSTNTNYGQFWIGTITLTEPDPLHSINTVNQMSCNTTNDASIAVSPFGGTSPYSFSWSTGESSSALDNLAPGNYQLTITDANSCTLENNFTIDTIQAITISFNAIQVDCNGNNSGVLSAIATGGSAPYTYNWSNGATSSGITQLSAGSYCVTVYDANSCSATACYELTEPLAISASASLVNPLCYGGNDGSISLSISGGNAPYQVNWSNGSTGSGIDQLNAGEYQVSISDANSCSFTETFVLSEPAELVSTGTTSDYNGYAISIYGANDGWIELTTDGGTSPYNYIWSNGASGSLVQNLVAGSYSVTLSDSNACSVNLEFNLQQPDLVIDPLSVTDSIVYPTCYQSCDAFIGVSVQGGLSPYTYHWSNGETNSSIDNLCAGDYSLTIFDSNFSTPDPVPFDWTFANTGNNHTIAIPFNAISIDGQNASVGDVIGVFYNHNGQLACGGYSVLSGQTTAVSAWGSESGLNNGFTVGESFTWKLWRASDSLVIDLLATYVSTQPNQGSYAINGLSGITSLSGNSPLAQIGDSLVMNYSIVDPLEIQISSTITSVTCNGLQDGNIELDVANGQSPYSYLWSTGMTTSGLNGIGGGNYLVSVMDASGCTQNAEFTVSEPETLLASLDVTEITCFGANNGEIIATATGGTTPYSYAWSNGVSTLNNSSLSAGTYQVSIIDANNCSLTLTQDLSEPQLLEVSVQKTNNLCFGAEGGSLSTIVSGGTSPYSFSWSNGSSLSEITALSSGAYCLTVMDANQCSVSLCDTITEPAAITLSLQANTIPCFGELSGSITVNANGGVTPYSFNWSDGESIQNLDSLPAGVYSLSMSDANNCNAYETIEIMQAAEIIAGFTINQVSSYGEQDGNIDLSVSGGTSPYTYTWTNGSSNQDLDSLPAGVYGVSITDSNGCSLYDQRTITEPLGALWQATAVTCPESCDGTIGLTAGGGVPPYSYIWSNGETGTTLDNLCAGTYELTIHDSNFGTPEPFNWTYNLTGENHSIAIPTGVILIDGLAPTPGDIIGVFYHEGNDLKCGGYQTWLGQNTAITAWGAEAGLDNGFVSGEEFIWKIWRSTDSTILSLTAQYTSLLPNQGTYTPNGMSGLESLVGSSASLSSGDSAIISIEIGSPLPMQANPIVSNPSCFGDSNGNIDLAISGGTNPYSVTWNTGQTGESIGNLSEGDYIFNAQDNNGCSFTDTISLDQPNELTVNLNADQILCYNDQNGSVTAQIDGGVQPYALQWSNGETSYAIYNLDTGNYTITVNDGNQCSVTASAQINEPDELMVSLSATAPSCFGEYNGSITSQVSGGISPYTYSWTDGSTSQNLENIGGGSYCLVAIDANGCAITNCTYIEEPTELALSMNAMPVSCYGENDGNIVTQVSGGVFPYQYSWSNQASSAVLTNIPGGVYSLTVSDANNCVVSSEQTVFEPAALVINDSLTNVSCNGESNGSASVLVSGGISPYTYLWDNSETNSVLNNLSAGYYTLTVSDNNSCQNTISISITQPEILEVELSSTDAHCYGGANGTMNSIVLGGTQPYTWTWSNGESNSSLDNLTAGEYCLSVTDANGCIASNCKTINQPDSLWVEASLSSPTCNGNNNGNISLSIHGGTQDYSYTWSNGATTQDIDLLSAGVYSLTVSDYYSCSALAEFILDEPDALSLSSVKEDVSCNGAYNGSIEVSVNGGTGTYSYQWSNNVFASSNENLGAGIYTLTVLDANNCSTSAEFTLTEPDPISINLTAINNLCNGDSNGSVISVISGGTSPYAYTWNTGAHTSSINNLAQGYYSLQIKDDHLCVQQEVVQLVDPDEINMNALVTNVSCYNSQDASIDLNMSGGTGSFTALWSSGDTSQNLYNLASGNYCVTLSDENNCLIDSCFTITEPDPLNISLQGTDLNCFESSDGEINTSVNGGTSPYVFNWSNGSQTQDIDQLSAAWYTLTLSDANNCELIDSVEITQPSPVLIDLGPDTTINMGENYVIDAGSGFASYLWNTGSVTQSITAYEENMYSITVSNSNGCTATDSMYLTVNPFVTQHIELHNSWNYMSLNVIPQNANVVTVLDSIVSNVLIVKNGSGQMYWPAYGINLIGNFQIGQGYSIKVNANVDLYVEGLMVIPENTPINLPQGNSMLGYLRQTEASIVDMLSPVYSSLLIVKDESGMMYWPAYNVNLIGNMKPGEGYLIKLSNASTLTYPANTANVAKSYVVVDEPVYYQRKLNTGNNMTLGIPGSAWDVIPENGSEIAVFDLNGKLIGSSVFNAEMTALSIWGDDSETTLKDAPDENDLFVLKIYDPLTNSEQTLTVTDWYTGNDQFKGNGISVVKHLAPASMGSTTSTSLAQNYPNPFNTETRITFNLNQASKMSLILYNTLGEQIEILADGWFEEGKHEVRVGSGNLPSGMYIYRLITENETLTRNMQIKR